MRWKHDHCAAARGKEIFSQLIFYVVNILDNQPDYQNVVSS